MVELTADQEFVLEVIKKWITTNEAAYLAKEDQLIFWGHVTIHTAGWERLTCKQASNIIKSTEIPVGLMKYCTADMVVAAAQEVDRVFTCAVDIHGEVKKEFFNLRKKSAPKAETLEHRIAKILFIELLAMSENILWTDVTALYDAVLKKMGLKGTHAIGTNKILRYGLTGTPFIERRATKNFNGRLTLRENGKVVQFTAISLEGQSGIKKEWTGDERLNIINRVVTSALK